MLLVGNRPAAFVLSMAFVGASVASATAPQTLAPSQCTITSMSGFDNLCLFYSFAYRTRLSAAVLRQQVCEYMRKNSGTIIPGAESDIRGVDYTIEQYVRDEGSDMNSLTVKRLRDEGAGLPVAGRLSMMLRRNVWVYILLNGAYQLILATTVVVDAPPLVLKFSLNGRGIGHYDIINLNERASVERPRSGHLLDSIWGETLRKKDLVPKSSSLKPTTQISSSTQGHRFRALEKVWYRGTTLATVLTVHVDEDPPYYTILQDDGVERQTELRHLQPANDPRFFQPTTTPMARTGTERASATGAPRKGVVKRDRYFEDEEVTADSAAIEVFATT